MESGKTKTLETKGEDDGSKGKARPGHNRREAAAVVPARSAGWVGQVCAGCVACVHGRVGEGRVREGRSVAWVACGVGDGRRGCPRGRGAGRRRERRARACACVRAVCVLVCVCFVCVLCALSFVLCALCVCFVCALCVCALCVLCVCFCVGALCFPCVVCGCVGEKKKSPAGGSGALALGPCFVCRWSVGRSHRLLQKKVRLWG